MEDLEQTHNPLRDTTSDPEDNLLGIYLDTDNYASTAANDTPTVPRGHQSEAAFQAQKASYTAKTSTGTTYADLVAALSAASARANDTRNGSGNGVAKPRLSKKDVQLLGYAVGELYYDRQYGEVVEVCARVRRGYEVDRKMAEAVERWTRRCSERLRDTGGGGQEGSGARA